MNLFIVMSKDNLSEEYTFLVRLSVTWYYNEYYNVSVSAAPFEKGVRVGREENR